MQGPSRTPAGSTCSSQPATTSTCSSCPPAAGCSPGPTTGRPFWTANVSRLARPPKHQPPTAARAAATRSRPCGVLLKAETMDGQTDGRCPCCGEQEEGELKRHGHPERTPARLCHRDWQQDCPRGPAAGLGDMSHQLWGSLYCVSPTARPARMDEVTLSVSLPLPSAQRGTDLLSILLSLLRLASHRVTRCILTGCGTKGLPWGTFTSRCPRSEERGGWKGRGSQQTLPRLPAPALLCHSLQLKQRDGYTLPCRKSPCSGTWGQQHSSCGSGHREGALRHCHT